MDTVFVRDPTRVYLPGKTKVAASVRVSQKKVLCAINSFERNNRNAKRTGSTSVEVRARFRAYRWNPSP